ncbi:VanZ family protein [Microgenomates group bacterium]|nr:VanZ family protein [Microgenomates group bacterium]
MTLYAFGCATCLCLIFQVVFLRKTKPSIRHFLWVYIFLFYLMMVYQVTGMGTVWIIGRYPELIRQGEISLIPFRDYHSVMASRMPYILNIFMTIPLGFLLPLIWQEFRSLRKIALTGFCLSLAIELSQLLNHRATTIDDLLMNTLGAMIGYLILSLLFKLFRKNNQPIEPIEQPVRFASKHEAIIYLIASFLGTFLFYNSLLGN